jgi:hypothetical protein
MAGYHDFDRVRGGWDRGHAPLYGYDRNFTTAPHPNYGYTRAYDVMGGYGYYGATTRVPSGVRPSDFRRPGRYAAGYGRSRSGYDRGW